MDPVPEDEEAQPTELPPTNRASQPPVSRRRGMEKGISRRASTTTMSGGVAVVEQVAKIRDDDCQEAMGGMARRKEGMKRMFGGKPKRNLTEDSVRQEIEVSQHSKGEVAGYADPTPGPQYTLKSRRKPPNTSAHERLARAVGFGVAIDSTDAVVSNGFLDGINLNKLLYRYLHWTFRTSFFFLFISSLVGFICLTLMFAGFIYVSGKNHPDCIQVGLETFGSSGEQFYDAFALSWTTFSTVGYGLVYPQVSTGGVDFAKGTCVGIALLTSLESFFGVMFTGFCGAILYGKVTRIGSEAQVAFSDPIVIRYGSGVRLSEGDDVTTVQSAASIRDSVLRDTVAIHKKYHPCPVLEFRIVNRLHSRLGGEIIDATLTCVAAIEEKTACPTIRGNTTALSTRNKSQRTSLFNRSQISPVMKFSVTQTIDESEPLDEDENPEVSGVSMATIVQATQTNQTIDEGNAKLAPRCIFSRMEVEPPDHPFFKRVWTVRHTLNATSPLLTAKARQLVEHNKGFWPEELNSWQGVRESIQFKRMLVSFSGTSNVNASSVFSQKIYDFVDVNIGYSFANALYKDRDGNLRVDVAITNDVMEQPGEDPGEPFQLGDDVSLSRVVSDGSDGM